MIKLSFSKYDNEIIETLMDIDRIKFTVQTASASSPKVTVFIDTDVFTEEVYNEFANSVGFAILYTGVEPVYLENTSTGKVFVIGDKRPEYEDIMKLN